MTTYNTGNPVPSVDVRDLYDNAQNLDEFSNSAASFATDRLGVSRQTLQGIRNASQYQVLGPYAAGLEFTSFNQVFSYMGEFYAPGPSLTLPYTTDGSGAPEIALFRSVGDAVLRQDLADDADPAKGAARVGYRGRTVADRLDMTLTPYDFGAIGDGIADDTAAVLAWAASTVSTNKHWGDGVYIVADEIVFRHGDQVTGNGPNSVVDQSAGIGAATACISVTGSLVALPDLGANVARGDGGVTFASAPDLVPGDAFIVFNPTDFSWSSWRAEYKAGEFMRAGTISGSAVTIYGLAYAPYVIADVDLYKLVGKSTSFKNFTIKQPATSNAGIKMSLIDSPIVEDVETGGGIYSGIYLDRCIDIKVSTRARQASASTGTNYGLVIGNCHGGSIKGRYYGTRHSISLGGGTDTGCVPTRALRIVSDQLNLTGNAGQDLHGNTEDITFIGGRFSGGQIAGKNHKWSDCTFLGSRTTGACLVAGEIVGGVFSFSSCHFDTEIDPNASTLGVISLQNFSADVALPTQFLFDNISIDAPTGCTYAIYAVFEGSAQDHSILVRGLTFTAAPSITSVFRLRLNSGAGAFRTIMLKDVSGLPSSGVAYATEVGAPTISKYKLPRQSGTALIPVTTAVSAASSAVVYAHSYPRTPSLVAGNTNPTIGGDRVVAGYTANSGTGFTAQTATADGGVWASNSTAGVAWSAELDEL